MKHGNTETCDQCSYQTNSEEHLTKHKETAHNSETDNIPAFKCNKCSSKFKTKIELTNHIKENHKSHKPCDYFLEDRCELDADCRFNHIKLIQGQQICYTCGLKFKSKK